ncbi:response regulator transcription factor [Paenibacillus sp. SYP-B4298]|uniref:response regulator transcription factor n=1 Tax=Paenibacillus sp. SYP-B4298 TaxID=2996034 RepID=UPI0022DD3B90|nr:response regulator transcription factor [Paenibacillus sp. SYP-B4298]
MNTVVIVDDEQFVRKGLVKMMDWEALGFHVIGEADNGEDAFAIIRANKPDLVVTDIRMPAMDGLELIQAVAEDGLDTEFIIISGYNDFRYAQRAIRFGVMDYVLKPVDKEDMTEILNKLRGKLEEKRREQERQRNELGQRQIEALLRGELRGEELARWSAPWVEAGAEQYVYVLVELSSDQPWEQETASDTSQIRSKLQEVFRRTASSPLAPIIYEHRRAYGLIIPDLYWRASHHQLAGYLQEVLHQLNQEPGWQYRAYTGETIHSLEQLRHSYRSAKEAVAYRFVLHQQLLLQPADIEGISLVYKPLQEHTHRQLIEAVEENKPEQIMQSVQRIFAECVEERFSPEAIKTAIVQCVASVIKSIREFEGDDQELRHIEAIIGWHDHNITWTGLRWLFEQFMCEAAEMISGLYRTAGQRGIYKVKSYVDHHFHKNINLKSIAAQFYMNSAYLGQLFKKSYGVYFNEYLLQLRIEEAKKLLKQGDLRIYEIADRVGFNSADYFVIQFEKLEKMTPTEYRNRWK